MNIAQHVFVAHCNPDAPGAPTTFVSTVNSLLFAETLDANGSVSSWGIINLQPAAGAGGDFMQLLGQTLDNVGDAGRRADAQAVSAASGKANVVDVVTAVAESETALQTMVAVRDRMISAYEEIMRMQI